MPFELLEIPATVTTNLNQKAFENLVTKSGQPCRWLYSIPCPCVQKSGSADADCDICNGRGFSYDFIREMNIYREMAIVVRDRVLKIAHPTIKKLISVTHKENGKWLGYNATILDENHVKIDDAEPFKKHNRFFVDYVFTPERDFSFEGIYQGAGHIVIPGLLIMTNHGGYVKPDIVSVETITPSIEIEGFYKNIVKVKDYSRLKPGDKFMVKGKQIPPYVFPISSINIHNNYEGTFLIQGGDAVTTVNGYIPAGTNDIITALLSEHRRSAIMSRYPGRTFDIIPSFDVKEILEIFEIDAEKNKKVFKNEIDYILRGRNELHWIGDAPEHKYSVLYFSNASFVVQPQSPSLRNHQQGRFPKKLTLKFADKISDFEV